MSLESLAVLAALVLALAPLAVALRQGRDLRSSLALVFLSVAAAFMVGLGWLRARELRPGARVADNRPTESPEDGYITSDNCRSCHPNAYATWHASFHSTMTQLPSEKSVKGDFGDADVTFEGASFRMSRRGDEYWVDMPALNADERVDPAGTRWERRIEMVTGSHHYQVYWFSAGFSKRLDQFPLVWLIDEGRWVPRKSSFLVPAHEGFSLEEGRWNEGCVRCHATGYKPRFRNEHEMYTTVAEFGISCEACHGPAEEHVAINTNPARRYGARTGDEADQSATLPTRLKGAAASQVCGQCHSVNVEVSVAMRERWRKEGYAYRPGDDLNEERDVIRLSDTKMIEAYGGMQAEFVRNFFWGDGMVRVAGREYNGMIEAPCHLDGHDGGMTCFSCHEMHPPADSGRDLEEWRQGQVKTGMRGNEGCLQCHGEFRDNVSSHTGHATESAGSLCYNCHMPRTSYGLLQAVRSHLVGSPGVGESVEHGRPNACNLCHLDKTLAWTARELRARYGLESPLLSKQQEEVASGLVWGLKGDAGQRALIAWSLGWDASRAAAGEMWQAPLLAELLKDPYPAIRFIAARSLRAFSGFENLEFDQEWSLEKRGETALAVVGKWNEAHRAVGEPVDRATLITGPGQYDARGYSMLLGERDNRPVILSE